MFEQCRNHVSFVTVDEDHIDQRIDNFLFRELKGVPKSRIYKLIRIGEIRVNKKRIRPNTKLLAGDIIRIAPIRTAHREAHAHNWDNRTHSIKLSILHEDDDLIVLDKKSGLATHGGSGISQGAIELLRQDRPKSKFLELVHRLDKDTSGCLMIAKKRSVLLALQRAMITNNISKTYELLVKERWPVSQKKISASLLKNQLKSGQRVVVVDPKGKHSVTNFQILRLFKTSTLLQALIVTGRTHQIRVHCQSAGQPIAGDQRYGDKEYNSQLRPLGLRRLFLHASSLSFNHPITGEFFTVKAPLPTTLQKVLDRL